MDVEVYDTTLRDGAQSLGVSFSLESRIALVRLLNEIATTLEAEGKTPYRLVHFVEGGFPSSAKLDREFFRRIYQEVPKPHFEIVPFGMTRRKDERVYLSKNIKHLLDAESLYCTIVGKSSDLHVRDVLRTDENTNLRMIEDTIRYLTKKGRIVFFDAEHFFEGCLGNPIRGREGNMDYAFQTLKVAEEAGAKRLILCETNGGIFLPQHPELLEELLEFREKNNMTVPLGIHTHNDGGNALDNSLYFIIQMRKFGEKLVQVQGTWNGFGERFGNADLCGLIPNIVDVLGIPYVDRAALINLEEISKKVYDYTGQRPFGRQPFVGKGVAHKGGIHIAAELNAPGSYSYFPLEDYGNDALPLATSKEAGKGLVIAKQKQFGLDLGDKVGRFLAHLKRKAAKGFDYESADASLELEMMRQIAQYRGEEYHPLFTLVKIEGGYLKKGKNPMDSWADVTIQIEGNRYHLSTEGEGPVHAVDNALRPLLLKHYSYLSKVELVDFRVKDVSPTEGTAAPVTAVSFFRGNNHTWETAGGSRNIIEASYFSLVDGYEYAFKKFMPNPTP